MMKNKVKIVGFLSSCVDVECSKVHTKLSLKAVKQ